MRHSSSTYQADIADLINCQWNLFYQDVTITVMHSFCIKLCYQFIVSASLFSFTLQFYLCSLTPNFWQMTSLSSMVQVMAYSNFSTKPLPKLIIFNFHQWDRRMLSYFIFFVHMCNGSNYNLIYKDVIPVWEIPLIARPPHEPPAILSCTPGLAGYPTQLWHGQLLAD